MSTRKGVIAGPNSPIALRSGTKVVVAAFYVYNIARVRKS